jgi:hypothetical protein
MLTQIPAINQTKNRILTTTKVMNNIKLINKNNRHQIELYVIIVEQNHLTKLTINNFSIIYYKLITIYITSISVKIVMKSLITVVKLIQKITINAQLEVMGSNTKNKQHAICQLLLLFISYCYFICLQLANQVKYNQKITMLMACLIFLNHSHLLSISHATNS